ncbi:Dolichyl-phosphate beta-glucosyltransferase [Frankliniella fusca]|uniref:Dolichyl-phosphate beta-glucosyltransferase n=1 Tax=Frankliniella fusca TaxID=407009 RepID=A0AAE1HCG9_9NEOP|nr:Dolichyl-phosphate beta-glucosyltransferase [Frankliniella fusca]
MMLLGFNLLYIFFYIALLLIILFTLLSVILLIITKPYPEVFRSDAEKYFKTINGREPFPSLNDKSSIHLSVVVPAYDEEKRLPPMLDECLEFLENRRQRTKTFQYEVIVVSDGSKDGTVKVASAYCSKYGSEIVRVLDLQPNRGKGGAVRLGIQSARGAVILFADADGATKFSDLAKLEEELHKLLKIDYLTSPEKVALRDAIICGSRAHLEDEAVASRSMFRTILMYGFHMLVWLLTVRGIRDTQCGFKLLTRSAASTCFRSLHVERWAFDVELLYIAQKLCFPIGEVAVNWTEIEGSKVVPVWSWLQMGRDLFLIWLRYQIGAWKLKTD